MADEEPLDDDPQVLWGRWKVIESRYCPPNEILLYRPDQVFRFPDIEELPWPFGSSPSPLP
jgi:hypothetical protein